MSYETIEIESESADRVHILTGIIVSTGDSVAEVNIDDYGTYSDIPVFYHCPESETADGMPFAVGDRVIIVNSGDAITLSISNMKVVGFEDGLPRTCCMAIENFTTEELVYTWESYVIPPGAWGWVTDNSSFSDDKMIFNMLFTINFGSVSLQGERFAKGFDSKIAANPYLVLYNLPGWVFSGGIALDVVSQGIKFFVVFQDGDNNWLKYQTNVYRHTMPSGLSEGVYYADIFEYFREREVTTEDLTLRAYGIEATCSYRFPDTFLSVVNIDKYDICPSFPEGATQLKLNESITTIADPSRYQ